MTHQALVNPACRGWFRKLICFSHMGIVHEVATCELTYTLYMLLEPALTDTEVAWMYVRAHSGPAMAYPECDISV